MPVVKVNDRDVHFQELNAGAAESVVLVHGMFSNLSVYYFHIAGVLAEKFHVVMYDLKSHGLSERAQEGYDLESMTADLAALLDKLGLTRVRLAGYSFGGLITLKMAACYPERIVQIAVIEAPDPADDQTRAVMEEYSREFLENYIRQTAERTGLKMGKRQLERNHRLYQYLFNQTTIKADMLLERDFFSGPDTGLVRQQVLLLYGADSNCLMAGRKLKDQLSRASLQILPGDHNLPVREPAAVAGMLLHFFNGTVNHI